MFYAITGYYKLTLLEETDCIDILDIVNTKMKAESGQETPVCNERIKPGMPLYDHLIEFYRNSSRKIALSPLSVEHDAPLVEFFVQPPVQLIYEDFVVQEKKEETTSFTEKLFLNWNSQSKNINITAGSGLEKKSLSQKMTLIWCQAKESDKRISESFDTYEDYVMQMFETEFPVYHCDVICCDTEISNQYVTVLPKKHTFLVILNGLDECMHPNCCDALFSSLLFEFDETKYYLKVIIHDKHILPFLSFDYLISEIGRGDTRCIRNLDIQLKYLRTIASTAVQSIHEHVSKIVNVISRPTLQQYNHETGFHTGHLVCLLHCFPTRVKRATHCITDFPVLLNIGDMLPLYLYAIMKVSCSGLISINFSFHCLTELDLTLCFENGSKRHVGLVQALEFPSSLILLNCAKQEASLKACWLLYEISLKESLTNKANKADYIDIDTCSKRKMAICGNNEGNNQTVVMDPRTHQNIQTNSVKTFDSINKPKVSVKNSDLFNDELRCLDKTMHKDNFKHLEAKCCPCACKGFQKIQSIEHKTSKIENKMSDVTESFQDIEHKTNEIVKKISNVTESLQDIEHKISEIAKNMSGMTEIINELQANTYTTSHALSGRDKVAHMTRNQSTQVCMSDSMLGTPFLRGELTGRGEDVTSLKTVNSTSTGSYKNVSTGSRRGCTVLDPPTTDWLFSIETRKEPEQSLEDLKLPDPSPCISNETDIKSFINFKDECSNENLAGNEKNNFKSPEQTLSSGYPVSTISSKGMTCTRSDLLENDSRENCDFERELDNSLSVTTTVNLVNDLDDVSYAETAVSCNKRGIVGLNEAFEVSKIKEETLQVEDHEDYRSNDDISCNKAYTTNNTINSIEHENSEKRNKVENIVLEIPRERQKDQGEINKEEERIHDVVYSDSEVSNAHLEENDDNFENENLNYASNENTPNQEIEISKYQDDILNESEGKCDTEYPVTAFSSTLRPSSFVHAYCGSTDEDIENCIGFRSNRKRKIQLSDSDFDYMDLKRYKATTLKEKTWNFIPIQGKNEKVLGCLFKQFDSEFHNIHFEVLVVGDDGVLRQVEPLAEDDVGKERKRSFSETFYEVKDGFVKSTCEQEDIFDEINKPALKVTGHEVGGTKFSKFNCPVIYRSTDSTFANRMTLKGRNRKQSNESSGSSTSGKRVTYRKRNRKHSVESSGREESSGSSSSGKRVIYRKRNRKHSVESSGREESSGSSSAEKVTFRSRNRKHSDKSSDSSASAERVTCRRRNRKHSDESSCSSTSDERVAFKTRNRKHLEERRSHRKHLMESSGNSTSAGVSSLRKRNRNHSKDRTDSCTKNRSITVTRKNRKRPKQSAGCLSSAYNATYRKCSEQLADSSTSATTAALVSRNDFKKPTTCTSEDKLESFDSGIELSAQCQYQILNELSHKVAVKYILDHNYETAKPSVCSHIPWLERQKANIKVRVRADSSQLKNMHKNYEKRINKYLKDKGSLTLEDFVKELHINHSTVQVFGLTEYFNRLTRGESLSDQQRMQYEWLRLASFQHYTGNGNALSLARNGFYHDPTDGPTSTRCYLCEARHSTWEYFDNIEAEHRRQSPDCPFHLNRSEESTNVSISYETTSQSRRAPATSTPSVHFTVSSPGIASTGSASFSQTQTPSQNIYQPQENDENRQHSLLALPNSRSYRALGRSGDTAYSHLTTPPRRNNISINASLDGFASSVPTSTAANTEFSSIPTSIATNTVSNSLPTSTATSTSSVSIQQSSIPSRAIAAGAFGGFNAPTSTSISTSSSTTSTSTSQSVSAPAVAAASSLQRPSQTPIGGGGLKAAVSSHLRPSQTPIGGGGRTDPTITVVVENAKHPDYRELDTRINSYQGWPDYLDQTARQMAEAGFFFVGVADFTRCFCCGGGLRNWEPGDDPMLEHTRWFPRCEYVNKLKGERYVAAVQRRHQQHMEEQQRQQQELARSRDANRNPPDPMSTEAAAVLREMGYQQERIKDAILTVRRQIGVPDVTTQQVLAWLLDQHEARSLPTSSRSSPTRDLGVKVNSSLPSSSIQTSTQSSVINSTPSVSTSTSAALTGSNSSAVSSTSTATGAGSQKSGSSTSTTSSSSSTEGGRKPTSQTGSKENGAKEDKSLGKQSAASGGESDEEFKSAEETLSPDIKPAKKKNRKKNKAKSGAKPSDAPSKLNVVDTQALKEENEKLREMQTCKICMERLVNTTLLPCGHLVCCDVCAARLNRCPICRKRIKGTVKTFMS